MTVEEFLGMSETRHEAVGMADDRPRSARPHCVAARASEIGLILGQDPGRKPIAKLDIAKHHDLYKALATHSR
jgi:hypothetical protein